MSAEVLVTDGGAGRSRDAVAAVRGLADAGYRPVLALSPGAMVGPVTRAATRVVHAPGVDDPAFRERVHSLAPDALTIIAASESAAVALGVVPERLLDKPALEREAQRFGIPTPGMRPFPGPRALADAADELSFPIVVKPVVKTFAAFRANRPTDVTRPLPEGPLVTQPFVDGPSGAFVGVMWGGTLAAAIHERWERTFPLDCGLPSAAVTSEPDLARETAITALLADYEGPFTAQFVGEHLIDLNLRIASTHALGQAAGVNVAAIWCDLLDGADPALVRARPGVSWRWLEGEVRGSLAALRTGKVSAGQVVRRLLDRPAARSIESLRDPGPMVARIVSAATGRSRTTAGRGDT